MKVLMETFVSVAVLGAALGGGCIASETHGTDRGNAELGVARFDVRETPAKTTLVGLDTAGAEVARLELTHGAFSPGAIFQEDFGGASTVDGRKLDVYIHGEQQLTYETAGYAPVTHMPAHPASLVGLIAFMHDPHVETILDRWQLGFEPQPADNLDGESAYYAYGYASTRGDSYANCDGVTACGSAFNGTINTCGNSAATIQAGRVTQHVGSQCGYYTGAYEQVVVTQHCPAGSGGLATNWVAQKACPTTAANDTMCGTRTTGACKGCSAYAYASGGYSNASVSRQSIGTCGGNAISEVSSSLYDATATTRIQAEAGTISGSGVGVHNNDLTGYEGSGFVGSFTTDGDQLTVSFPNVTAGTYNVRIRYHSYPSEQNNVSINGGAPTSQWFPTQMFGWGELTIPNVSLTSGTNTVTISKDWGWIEVDWVEIVRSASGPTTIHQQAETATLSGSGVSIRTDIAGYEGTGFVGSFTSDGDTMTISIPNVVAGTYTLWMRYHTWTDQQNDLNVNSGGWTSQWFPSTGTGWTVKSWPGKVLPSGTTTVALRKDWGFIDVDWIEIVAE